MNKKPIKLALLGSTGVGKDTAVSIIRELFPELNIYTIRLADPLYQAQKAIYALCGVDKDYSTQDGVLLNFLGQHMRKINPDVLKDHFKSVLKQKQNADVIICSDVRPVDAGFVRESGFYIVNIAVDPSLAIERRRLRGDLTLGNSAHQTEEGLSCDLYDKKIVNNDSLQVFANELKILIEDLIK